MKFDKRNSTSLTSRMIYSEVNFVFFLGPQGRILIYGEYSMKWRDCLCVLGLLSINWLLFCQYLSKVIRLIKECVMGENFFPQYTNVTCCDKRNSLFRLTLLGVNSLARYRNDFPFSLLADDKMKMSRKSRTKENAKVVSYKAELCKQTLII